MKTTTCNRRLLQWTQNVIGFLGRYVHFMEPAEMIGQVPEILALAG